MKKYIVVLIGEYIIVLIGVAALLATVFNSAAQTPITAFDGKISVPLYYLAGTTNYPLTNCPTTGALKQRMIALEGSICAASPGATNVYTFAPSESGTYVDTNTVANYRTFTVYCIGTGPVTCTTNFDTLGNVYYKLISVVTTGTATNSIQPGSQVDGLGYATKISSP